MGFWVAPNRTRDVARNPKSESISLLLTWVFQYYKCISLCNFFDNCCVYLYHKTYHIYFLSCSLFVPAFVFLSLWDWEECEAVALLVVVALKLSHKQVAGPILTQQGNIHTKLKDIFTNWRLPQTMVTRRKFCHDDSIAASNIYQMCPISWVRAICDL